MGQLGMTESDYAWITDQLVMLAERTAQGRIVSVLEGGYNLSALGRSAVALQLDTGEVDAFPAFATRLRTALHDTWQRETFDHLVNNAGHGDTAPIADTTVAQFDRLVDVHFKGVFSPRRCCR